MKTLLALTLLLLSITNTQAQINNSKTETVKVYGNCDMCKTKIEKAGTIKNIAATIWNDETGMATITYDSTKTNADAVLKNIAAVGYDSENFKASNAVYAKLPGCCKYERSPLTPKGGNAHRK